MIQSTLDKESYLKDSVVKIRERNLSDFEMLDSLFDEIKQEFQNQDKI